MDDLLYTSGDRVTYPGFTFVINVRRYARSYQYRYLYDALIGSTGQSYSLRTTFRPSDR